MGLTAFTVDQTSPFGSEHSLSGREHDDAGGEARAEAEAKKTNAASAAMRISEVRERENAEDLEVFREFTRGLARGAAGAAEARQAYTKLYLKYRERVYAYCLRVLCDEDEAQDLFQEVFFRVFTRAAQFEEQKSLGGWIFTIAHNLCLNKIRDRKQTTQIEELTLLVSPPEDYGENWKDRIEWAMAQIPVDYREAFILREYEGLSYQEITVILNTTMPAIKSRIYRAKERLRELLEPYYNESNK